MSMSGTKRPTNRPGSFTCGLLPRHYEGKSPESVERARKAEIARRRRIQWLKRAHVANPYAQALAAKLKGCRASHRCRSGACPACAQAAQELFVEMVKAFSRKMTGASGT